MIIEDLQFRIFENLNELKKTIKKNFKIRSDCKGVGLIKNKGIDDELCFFSGDYCYSVYIMRGSSGRVIVVETSKQRD